MASRPAGRREDMEGQKQGQDESDDQGRPDAEDADRVAKRAKLLPEERAAESDDPEAQAAAVLADSDERTEDPQGTRGKYSQTPDHRD